MNLFSTTELSRQTVEYYLATSEFENFRGLAVLFINSLASSRSDRCPSLLLTFSFLVPELLFWRCRYVIRSCRAQSLIDKA